MGKHLIDSLHVRLNSMTGIAPSPLLTNAGRRERDATGLVIQPGHWVQRVDSTRRVLQVIAKCEDIQRVCTFDCQDGQGFYFGIDGPDVKIIPEPRWARAERTRSRPSKQAPLSPAEIDRLQQPRKYSK